MSVWNPVVLELIFARVESLTNPSFRVLFVQPEPDGRISAIASRADVTILHSFRSSFEAFNRAGLRVIVAPPTGELFDLVVVMGSRYRDQNLGHFALAGSLLREGGTVLSALPNTLGAARFEGHLGELFGATESISKAKSRIFWATRTEQLNQTLCSAWLSYLDPHPVPGTPYRATAGVFSSDGIDPATELLVATLPEDLTGSIADLGGGWGALSAEILRRKTGSFTVALYEADARAVACATANLTTYLREGRCTVEWGDVTRGVGSGCFDCVVMNPPFHRGSTEDPLLGVRFIESAFESLREGGVLYLVSNEHLPYEKTLTTLFSRVEIISRKSPFLVRRATRV